MATTSSPAGRSACAISGRASLRRQRVGSRPSRSTRATAGRPTGSWTSRACSRARGEGVRGGSHAGAALERRRADGRPGGLAPPCRPDECHGGRPLHSVGRAAGRDARRAVDRARGRRGGNRGAPGRGLLDDQRPAAHPSSDALVAAAWQPVKSPGLDAPEADNHVDGAQTGAGGTVMQSQERDLITGLFDRLRPFDSQPRDPEAERLIAEGVARQPSTPYLLTQTVLVQEQALKAAQERIAELEAQMGGGQQSPGFLGSARRIGPWGSAPASAAPTTRSPLQAAVAPPSLGGGGFLRTALTTAAGVAGGALLFEGIRSMFGHSVEPFGTAAAAAPLL